MDVIWHDHECVKDYRREAGGQVTPSFEDGLLNEITLEEQLSVMGAYRDEVRSGLRVVVGLEADRASVMDVGVVRCHARMIQGRGKQASKGRGEQRPYAVVPDIESLPSQIATLYRRLTE